MLALFGMGGDGMMIVLVVAVALLCLVVVPVAGIVAIVYIVKRPKAAPQPVPAPAPAARFPAVAAAALAPKPVPVPPVQPLAAQPGPAATQTVVMGRQCPQCGAALPADAPEGLCPGCLLQRGLATEAGPAPNAGSFVPPSIDELARLFPQLELLECLGRGGMGAVYKARQPRLDRFVALKILAPDKQNDPQFAERFEREARVLARLSHPNIVAVHDFGEVQGRFYLLMEYVDGLTLRQVMQHGKMAPAEALQLVPKICEALQFAHEHGIVHRDIKPENILLDKQGHVKIADFGIAKIAGVEAKGLTLTGVRDVVGTPAYMAPEQVEKPQAVDHRADIYSLGVVFYEMLTGELPLGKFAPPSKMVQVDVRLDEVVLHALEKEPARRYQQASQVKTAVETIAGTPPPIAPVPGVAAAAAAPVPAGNPSVITAPAVALMVIGAWKVLSGFMHLLALSGLSGALKHFFGGLGIFGGAFSAVAIVSTLLFSILPGLLIFFGGHQMLQRRSYAWAVAAGIIAILACSWLSVLSLPIGIWALVVLSRDDVKAAFPGDFASATPGRPDHFWRHFTVAVVCVIVGLGAVCLLAASYLTMKAMTDVKATADAKEPTSDELQKAGFHEENGEYRKTSVQTFPLAADGRFSIDNVNGEIVIHGWNSNCVVVTAAIHGKSGESVENVKINVDAAPDRVHVHTDLPENHNGGWHWSWFRDFWGGRATVDYTVQVPQHVQLPDISSVNGVIAIDGVAGSITASTVNGETRVKNAAQSLKLSTVNGTITAQMDSLQGSQSVSLDSVNGEMELTVPADADAAFTVTTVNGEISSDFPSLQAKHEFPVGNNLKGSLGHGSAAVKANAVNGTVKFLKNPATKSGTNAVPPVPVAGADAAPAIPNGRTPVAL